LSGAKRCTARRRSAHDSGPCALGKIQQRRSSKEGGQNKKTRGGAIINVRKMNTSKRSGSIPRRWGETREENARPTTGGKKQWSWEQKDSRLVGNTFRQRNQFRKRRFNREGIGNLGRKEGSRGRGSWNESEGYKTAKKSPALSEKRKTRWRIFQRLREGELKCLP